MSKLTLFLSALIAVFALPNYASENEYQKLLSRISDPAKMVLRLAKDRLRKTPELLNTAGPMIESAKRHLNYSKDLMDPYMPIINRALPFTAGAIAGLNCAKYPGMGSGIMLAAALNGGVALYGFCNQPRPQSEYSALAKAGRFIIGGALCWNATLMAMYSVNAFNNYSDAASIIGLGLSAMAGLKALNMMGLHNISMPKRTETPKATEEVTTCGCN